VALTRTWKDSHGLNRCLRVVGLAKSSWYDHQRSQRHGLSAVDQWLKAQLVAILGESPAYGWRKLTAEVRARTGQPINHKRVRRVLADQQLQLQRRVSTPPSSPIDQIVHAHRGELNRLSGRTFGPFGLLSGDFTQLTSCQGRRRAWLAGFYDPASCLPVGWAVGRSANTALALEAWQRVQDWYARWEHPLDGVVVHTDQDTVFRSYRWLHQLLCGDHVEVSYSEHGAKDNPWIESLWSRLKAEVGQVLFESETLQELQDVVADYVDYYRHQRRHQSLDQQIPIEVLRNQNKNGALDAQVLAHIVL
jgi:putative transposase